jgi:hypothetical protein
MPSGEAKRRKLVPAKENATATTAKFWAGPPTPLFAKTNDGESTVKLWSAKSIPVWGETIAMAAVAMTNTFVPDWSNSQETTPAGAVKAAGETGTTAGDTTSVKQEPAGSKERDRRKEKGKERKEKERRTRSRSRSRRRRGRSESEEKRRRLLTPEKAAPEGVKRQEVLIEFPQRLTDKWPELGETEHGPTEAVAIEVDETYTLAERADLGTFSPPLRPSLEDGVWGA